jgi:amino acid adenylation domain-containing protein
MAQTHFDRARPGVGNAATTQEQLAHWRARLADAPALLELPADRPRPARQERRIGTTPVLLSPMLSGALRQLSQAHGVTLQSTLLAAFGTLLSRLSGQATVVVGVAQADALSLLPLAIDSAMADSMSTLIASVHAAHKRAASGPALALADLAAAAESYQPLCQALLACDTSPDCAPATGAFDIALVLATDGPSVQGHLAYAAALFDQASVAAFARYLEQALRSLAADPAQPAAMLSILPPREREQILIDWNATERATGPFGNAHDFVQAQIERTPNAIAVCHAGATLTYRQLGQRANAVAQRLLEQGVQPGDLVALFVRRSTDMVVGLLGILKAGAGYVPVDPSFPAERVAYMLEDAAARCVVTELALTAYLPQGVASVLLEEIVPTDSAVHVAVDPGSVSYAIYTSGSTGKPKGVLLPHRAMVNLFAAMLHWPCMNASDTIVAVTTLSFDISLVEVLLPLTVGARIEVADAATAADGVALARLADACQATIMQATPASWRMLLDAGWQGRPGLKIISGGEPLPRELANRLLARVAELWNLYGPSETTTYSTGERIFPGDDLITIGKPVANTRAYIVDRNMQVVPVGVPGELLLGGLGVGIGYNARPDLTAEKFIADPFSGQPGARLYRTGDLARWSADGRIELLGRIDNQVKLRGFRIELDEIESVLNARDDVRQAVVVCREDRPGDKRLVAYIAADPAPELAAVRAGLARALPSYMIPGAFVVLDQFPLTPTGKVDRRALPAPARSALDAASYAAPQGSTEQAIALLWQDLLAVELVGRDDNFFALGGHSLLAGQMIARLRRQHGVELALRDLFDHPTVAALAPVLERAAPAGWTPILAAERSAALALSFAQQRLWFLDQLDPAASAAYHLSLAFTFSGVLQASALRGALNALLRRHESLRTTFVAEAGVPCQRITEAPFALREQDLRQLTPAERDALYGAEIARPFNLAEGPLIRGLLAQLDAHTHELLLVQHHIVSDGWSLGVLQRELAALYASFCRGEGDCLPPPALQYADYAAWQNTAGMPAQASYWRAQLAGAPALLELPTDHPRPARQSYRGGQVALTLAPALTAALRSFSQEHGATLFMTLLAGWSALLARLSGQDDIVIGTPVANRPRPELEGLIGFFVNTLALRVRLDGDPCTSDLLARIRSMTLDAYAHQDLPFDQVVDAVKPVRDMRYGPLFQSALAVNNTPAAPAGLALRKAPLPHATTHFDLSLLLDDDGGTVAGHIEFASDLFERASVERMASSLQTLLAAMLAAPTLPLSRLPLLSASERQAILAGFNQSATPYPRDALVHQLFEQRASATPHAIALEYQGQRLSYGALDVRANQLAHALLATGVQPDDLVGVLLERSAQTVIAMLAILKAGGAYLPIDTSAPLDRIAYILGEARPKALLTEAALVARLPQLAMPILLVDAQADLLAMHAKSRPQVANVSASNLAYVIYTSGSTGAPKGVMVEHRSVLRLVLNNGFAQLGSADCVAHCANPAFDASTWEIWAPLLAGARVLVVPQSTLLDPQAFNQALQDADVSAMFMTVGLFNEYADQLAGAFGRLTWLLVGGDKLDPQRTARVARQSSRPRFFLNGYGPTETTTFATTFSIGEQVDEHRAIPIGKPISNTEAYILDAHLEPVPVGVVGEIYLGGDGVARGYINRDDLTAERFVHTSMGRLYRTGDLGKWLADGNIDYMGRNDFQVKIRGFRIELGEIEAQIGAMEDVTQVVVLCREDRPGDKRLVAYLTAPQPIDAAQLRARLAGALPAYMIPSAFVRLERLPLTANGKLDRRALPDPGHGALALRAYEAPHDGREAAIAAIVAELLVRERVSRHDSFFELGGHSLLAVRLVARLRQAFNADIALAAVFEHPTIAALAQVLSLAGHAEWSALPLADRSRPLRLSFAQQRLWFLEQLDRDGALAYHIPVVYRLAGDLRPELLQRALDQLLDRHESLRTTFASIDGVPCQRIAPAGTPFSLREHDLDGQAPAAKQALYADEIARPFDFSSGPLVRALLVRVAPGSHELLLVQHHIISDGWSLGVMLAELAELYGALCAGRPNPLAPLAIQYADYAAAETVSAEQLDFWRAHLHGAPALLELPTDRPRPAHQSFNGGQVAVALDPALTASLRQLGAAHGATLFMTLLAAWALLLARLSGQQDVVIGTPVANRQRPELEPLVGLFVNTLALRVRLDDNPTVTELLARTKEHTLAAFAHQEAPFDQVVEALNPVRSFSYSPLFQNMLALNNTPACAELAMGDLRVSEYHAALGKAQVDLSLHLSEDGERLTGYLSYATDLFDHATAEGFAGCLRQLLASMVATPQLPASTLAILEPALRQRLLVEWNDTARDIGPLANAHDFIAAQIARTPDAVAVGHNGASMTYRQLGQRANAVAADLLERGVQPGELVALFVRRSPDMMAAILGILKAGAAYVPVDPSFPADRVAYMLQDANARCVVTEAALSAWLPPGVQVLMMDAVQGTDVDVHVAVDPAGPSYVIYTSGSTGRPKGVLLPHRALVNLFVTLRDWPGMSAADTVVAVTTLSFDISIVEVLLPLTLGARIEVADAATAADGMALARLADACQATVMQATPASWRMLLDAGWQGRAGLKIISGGEPLPRELADRLLARVDQLWNLYGPSETTTYSTGERVHAGAAAITVGKPMANTQAYIVDRQLQPVPVGVAGELLLGGFGVGIGYNARAQLTAEKFIADPFSGIAGSRLYRSGDLARWTRDGRIDVIGRIDNQVKLRGFRIELGEIEAVLREHAEVRQSVVLCREDRPGDKRLVAYLAAPAALDLDAVRARLAQALPSYMVPSAFVVLEQFPHTPNGKVDRNALPAPDRSAVAPGQYQSPQGEREMAVALVWQELLGLDRVGRDDDFFAIGGHSLLAGQLVARLRRQFNVELTLRELFNHPTVAALSATLALAQSAAWTPILPAERGAPLALSLAQQRLWFLDRLDRAAGLAYHMPLAYRLQGRLDRTALRAALERLMQRHDSLRTAFPEVDGVPHQLVSDQVFSLHELELAGSPESLYAQEIARPFDLARGPLMRALLVRLGPDLHELLLIQHHIISDGWSLGVMLAELAALYDAFCRGQADPLPALALQYVDYAAWQHADAQVQERARQLDYWRTHLQGAPALLELPLDRPRPAHPSHRGASVTVNIAPELGAALRALGQDHGVTLFMTLLAAWSALMARFSGQDDVVIGTPVANRPRPELEALIGFFVNTLALRVNLADDPSVAQLLARVKTGTLAAYAHQDVPLDQVVDAVKPLRNMSYNPLFQTVLALNNTPAASDARFGELTLSAAAVPVNTTHFDLSLMLADDGVNLGGAIVYASDLFDSASIERLGQSLQVLLAAMAATPSLALSRLPLLTGAERARILLDFNRTAAPYPRNATIVDLFEQNADATPAATALEYGAEKISYAQLDARANALAHGLIGMGVQRGDRVALILERSADLVVAMLATLKAGAAYVPIETNCPPERMAAILADASPRAVVEPAMLASLAPQAQRRPGVQGIHAGSLACVIYTSGSTGQPKGVMVEHRNVLRLVCNSGYAPLGAADCVAHCANPAFDASTWEIWGALLNGARVLVVPHATLLDPKLFNRALLDGGVTALWLTAGLFNEYADKLAPAFAQLTWLLAGGDVLDPASVARVLNNPSRPRHLLNGYGPTETTTFATTHLIDAVDGASIPIGRPIANTTAYILDAHQEPVPLGVAGEIHIGGDGVTRGYLNQQAMTAERFIADPFGGERLYRTGDLGRWRADGSIEFMGRNDFQVKIRGFRIEPGEIEARLAACAGIREALVVARDTPAGDKTLVAYLVGSGDIDLAALQRDMKAALPSYMQPGAYVVLERLPLTANGKVDRRALPAPAETARASTEQAPLTPGQQRLADIWRALLGREHIDAHDSFFDLGGNSLMATRLVSRIEQQYAIDYPLRAVFEAPQLATMADRIAIGNADQQADTLEELLLQLEKMSDEQASAQLHGAVGSSITLD